MSDYEFTTAWRSADPAHAAEGERYWRRLGLITDAEKLRRRASELCVLGYENGLVVAETTAKLMLLPGLRQRFAMIRVSVDPAHRRSKLGGSIVGRTKQVLERWSAEHLEEKIMGMGAILTADELHEKRRDPLWADYDVYLVLIGFLQTGEQIRVAWFRHARV